MIKKILDFIKNLFSSTKPEEPVAPAPKLNTEAPWPTWPFPSSVGRPDTAENNSVDTVNLNTMAGDYVINVDTTDTYTISTSDITLDLSTEPVAAVAAPAVKAPPPVKLSPGPVKKRKPKPKPTKK
jgi:hypothetical protein